MPLDTERQRIQHLLRRTGWGYSLSELEEYVALGLEGAVERLLSPETVDDSVSDSHIAAQVEGDPRENNRRAAFEMWYLRMLTTRRPLLERMTLFWTAALSSSIRDRWSRSRGEGEGVPS